MLSMGTKLDIAYWNDVMEELGKYYTIEHIKPIYGREYLKIKLIPRLSSNLFYQQPTEVTIKSNRYIVFSVDYRIYKSPQQQQSWLPQLQHILQGINIKQKEYSKSSAYKGRIRIVCGHKQIVRFLGQFPKLAQYI